MDKMLIFANDISKINNTYKLHTIKLYANISWYRLIIGLQHNFYFIYLLLFWTVNWSCSWITFEDCKVTVFFVLCSFFLDIFPQMFSHNSSYLSPYHISQVFQFISFMVVINSIFLPTFRNCDRIFRSNFPVLQTQVYRII